MKRSNRKYRIDVPQHVYLKGLNGQCIFYGLFDHLVFLTQYTCSAERMGITTVCYSHMPNHFHSQNKTRSLRNLRSFILSLEPSYAKEYNKARGISGPVFLEPFGSTPKATRKLAKSNACYINCNCTVGLITSDVLSYRWNLLAYYYSDHPFSEKIFVRQASAKMRKALRVVRYMRRETLPLNYVLLADLYEGLDKKEKAQLTDFIVSVYNPVSYEEMIGYFGSFEKAVETMTFNEGTEYDLKEDWEDYSQYYNMLNIIREKWPGRIFYNVNSFSPEEKFRLKVEFSYRTNATPEQIRKFLHLK